MIETARELLSIGFCKSGAYKPNVWKYAMRFMDELAKQRLVKPYDFGRGKGKYITNFRHDDILENIEMTKEIIKILIGYQRYLKKLKINKFYKGEYNYVKSKKTAN